MIGRILGKKGARHHGPTVRVAAFGKHPAWNDHVEDIGLDTESLVELRRLLYLDGIGGNIDSGAWDSLGAGALEGFSHVFCRSTHASVIVGRMWSSTDGVGRAKYPFVAVAEITDMEVPDAVRVAVPALIDLERSCRSTQAQQGVIGAVGTCSEQLRSRVTRPATVDPTSSLATLLSNPALGPNHRGAERILYQIQRDFGAYVPRGSDSGITRMKSVDLRPQHIRVPSCIPDATASLAAWSRFFATRLDPACPIMLIRRIDGHWIDVIAGKPGPAELFCLRAGVVALPLATEVPYTIDPEFASTVSAWLAEQSRR